MKRGRRAALTMALSLVLATASALAIPVAANAAPVTACSPWQPFVGYNLVGKASLCITRETLAPGVSYLSGSLKLVNQGNTTLFVGQRAIVVDPNPVVSAGPTSVAPAKSSVFSTPWYVDQAFPFDRAMAQVSYWRSDLNQYAVLNLVTPWI